MLFRTGSSWLRFAVVAGALTAILAIRSSAQIPTEWEWVNPTPHGMQLADIAMLDESFGIIVCGSGYIMRTWDAGKTWTNTYVINDRFTDMSVTPSGTIFAAVESGGILKSTDRGDSWVSVLSPDPNIYGTDKILMYDDLIGMACLSYHDMYRTSDGGQSWEAFSDTLFPYNFREIACHNADEWYILDNFSSDVLKTTDFGDTWFKDEAAAGVTLVNDIKYFTETEGFMCCNGGLRRTTDGGASWHDLNLVAGNVIDIQRGGTNNTLLYALAQGEGTFSISTDNGDTWSTVIDEGMFETTHAVGCAFNQAGNGIIIGNAGFLATSENGGITWDIIHGFGYGSSLYDMDFPTPDYGIAVNRYGDVLISSDQGITWTMHSVMDSVYFQLIEMVSPSEGYAVGVSQMSNGYVYRTSDGGLTWEQRATLTDIADVSYYNLYQLQCIENYLFISMSKGRLLISEDYGNTFRGIIATTMSKGYASTGNPLLVFPGGGIVYQTVRGAAVSTDYGVSWTGHIHDRGDDLMTDISFYSTSEGYAIIDSALVFTNDGGETWSDDILDHCAKVQFWNRNCGVVWRAQHNGDYLYHEIAATIDGGTTWSHRSMGEAPTWRRWHWATSELGFGYGLYGEIRRTTTSGVTPVQPTPILPASLRLEAFYPNPVSLAQHTGASMRLTLPAGAPQHITVSVYDMLGRKTEIAYRGFMDAGAHIVSIPQSAFRLPGLYTLAVSAGEKRVTKRVVVVE